jgi:hypothetical protein
MSIFILFRSTDIDCSGFVLHDIKSLHEYGFENMKAFAQVTGEVTSDGFRIVEGLPYEFIKAAQSKKLLDEFIKCGEALKAGRSFDPKILGTSGGISTDPERLKSILALPDDATLQYILNDRNHLIAVQTRQIINHITSQLIAKPVPALAIRKRDDPSGISPDSLTYDDFGLFTFNKTELLAQNIM